MRRKRADHAHLISFGKRGGNLFRDFGQLVHDALHHGGVSEVLESVTAEFENLHEASMVVEQVGSAPKKGISTPLPTKCVTLWVGRRNRDIANTVKSK